MMNRLNEEISSFLIKAQLPVSEESTQIKTSNQQISQDNYSKASTNNQAVSSSSSDFNGREGYREAMESSYNEKPKQQPVIAEPKVGRNDACPCGSGKKYKQCHGK